MRALVKERPGPGLSLRDIEPPQVENPDDVLFRVAYCSICVGETKVYEWSTWAAEDKTLALPTVLGHRVYSRARPRGLSPMWVAASLGSGPATES